MKFNRIGRILVCFVLICALVVNISPIKVQATGAGAALGVIKGASLVSVPVAFWAVAALVALGVMVDLASDADYTQYNGLVDNVTNYLTEAGTYVKDGMVDMYRVVDETGKAVFYAAGDAMEAVRGWLFDSGALVSTVPVPNDVITSDLIAVAGSHAYAFSAELHYGDTVEHIICYSDVAPIVYENYLIHSPHNTLFYFRGTHYSEWKTSSGLSLNGLTDITYSNFGANEAAYNSSHACTLGIVSSVPIDGTGAREWSEEYTNNGLYIVGTGGGGDNNPNDGKWFWPLAFTLILADLYAMSQVDEWSGETPAEFDQYVTKEELTVSPGQELEFGQSIEVSPATDPDTDPDSGTSTTPDVQTDYSTWFQKVIEGITELPQKIANAFKSLLQELFVPAPEFIPNKVEALKAEYKFLDPILSTGEELKLFFQNIGSQPPIIWIDLGAGTGWYPMGGKVKFVDLTWYSQYKPTVDPIVGGFIWLWLAWRMFKAVPGLLSGDSGTVGAPTIAPDITFNPARLPAGRSRRKKDGE